MIRETSRESFRLTKKERMEQKELVRKFYRENPDTCDGECSRATGIPRALVAARRADLGVIGRHENGKIFECGHKISPVSGKRVLTWGAV